MVDHKPTGDRYRADQVPDELDKKDLTEPRQFNLMFETSIGPVQNENSNVYLRPETAQGIFVNFENVLRTMRAKIPFGIANIGKSFRNEITPGQFIFRTREFEQMEIEFFCKKEDENKWFDFWVNKRMDWYKSIGIPESNLRLREHSDDELAHYASKTVDIEFLYPWGWGELEGIANRGTFDLSSHEKASGKDLSYFDPETNEKIIPTVIEPAGGLTRTLFALLCSSYDEDEVNDTTRTLFRFEFDIAPIQIGILPLSKKDDLIEVSNNINNLLQESYRTEIDVTQSIGKRYRRQDEIGTPYCITVDFETLDDKSVTIRNRDSMEQERVAIADLLNFFSDI
jgi:glycyl-tRNA synthetase